MTIRQRGTRIVLLGFSKAGKDSVDPDNGLVERGLEIITITVPRFFRPRVCEIGTHLQFAAYPPISLFS
jgi:hypothetical protein